MARRAPVLDRALRELSDSELIKRIRIAWQGMDFDSGKVATLLVEVGARGCWPDQFPTFRAWIASPPPGLDRDPDMLLGILHRGHLPRVEYALIRLMKAPHGGDRRSEVAKETKVDNIHFDPRGTSAPRALIRLAKDRKDLHARVLAGELSAHAAMVDAGFRKRALYVPNDPDRALARLIKWFGLDTMRQLMLKHLDQESTHAPHPDPETRGIDASQGRAAE